MENARIYPLKKEYIPHAQRLETPLALLAVLRESAESIGQFKKHDELINNLVDFKQNIFDFMSYFNLDLKDFESDQEDKKFAKGGFVKGAVQKHPFLGVNGLRLVRDKLSDGVFLKKDRTELYRKLLERKIVEETVELTKAMNRKERREELGDVFEVFNTYLSEIGVDKIQIEDRRRIKELNVAKKNRRKLQKKK